MTGRGPRDAGRTSPRLAAWCGALGIAAITVLGCDGDGRASPGDSGPAGSSAGRGAGGGPGTGTGGSNGSGGGDGGGETDPWKLVPPEPLLADPAVDCPAAYKTTAPQAGQNGSFPVAGQPRAFWLILPDPRFTGPRPLFVGFNGTSEQGQSFAKRAKLARFAELGFVVIAPSSVGNGSVWPVWDGLHAPGEPDAENKDLALFDNVVRCVAAHHPIDAHRIYAGGHSAGGIMANYLIQRRSELLAGGVVGSGVFSLTSPPAPEPLDDLLVLVTWGGDNDVYSGSTPSGVTVPAFGFVEQASLASQFYAAQPNVAHARCSGDDFGHAWLDEVNDWMVELLLAHPKGLSGKDGLTLPPVPPRSGVSCSAEPFVYEHDLTVTCPARTSQPGCETACQLMADCVVENATVGPVLGPALKQLGFSGARNQDCAGCVDACEQVATAAADDGVLACISAKAEAATCGPGIEGSLPALAAIDACCDGREDSPFCVAVCGVLRRSGAAAFLPACAEL